MDAECMEKLHSVVALVGIAVVVHFDTLRSGSLQELVVLHTCGCDHDPKAKLQKLGNSIEEYDM